MRALITGATGFIGSPLCEVLHGAGHMLSVLTRDPQRAERGIASLERAFSWRATEGPPPEEAFEGVEAIIHLAGEPIAGRWTAAKKRAIRETRIRGTRHLIQTLERLDEGPRVLISASAVGYYGDRGEETLTEDTAPGSGFLSEVCRDWEEEVRRAEAIGIRVVRLRFGLVLGAGGGALHAMLTPFKLGLGGPMGSGNQWWPWGHRDDVVGLVRHSLENEVSGPVNACAPNPVRQKEFARTLGRVLRRPALIPLPAFALKLVLGEFANELLISQRVSPQRALEAGYRFRFPELEPALRALLPR